MAVTIKRVKSRSDFRQFVDFPYALYKGCPNWVPPLRGDEFDTFNPKKNAAFEFCEAQCFIASKDGKTVGRVAAIINRKANIMWEESTVRFGWLDFIEDEEVLKALLDTVAEWGIARGCTSMKGPLGFTDMDKEGLLVEGYENLSPFTCLYNYPYYDTLLKRYGMQKEVDWTQSSLEIPDHLPAVYEKSRFIEERFGLHVFKPKSMLELYFKYGMDLFRICNIAFAPLFQFTPLTDKQIKSYLATYVPILDRRYVSICLNSKEQPVGFAFCVPSLSKAVQKCKGRLFPFGFINILKALRKNDTLEALMIGVLPEYQGRGASLLLMKQLHENCIKAGIKTMIMNPQLEHNRKVQTMFSMYDTTFYMRRRAYTIDI